MTVEEIDEKYKPRLFALAQKVYQLALVAGFGALEPQFMVDEEVAVWLTITRNRDPHPYRNNDYDLRFEINPSEHNDGTEGGVTFSIHLASVGGRVIGGFSPFNYRSECWVDRNDEKAVEERFKLLEEFDHSGWIDAIVRDIEKTRTTETLWGEIYVNSGKLCPKD